MAKRSKGFFSKGTKAMKMKRKLTVNDKVKQFSKNDRVIIAISPYYRGVPHPRYNSLGGEIIKKQGNSYVVQINDGNARKELIVNPVHIKKA
ncbi:MAG: 50S ribosomal protein L21e [Candidatus Paceibacteria bacterium]